MNTRPVVVTAAFTLLFSVAGCGPVKTAASSLAARAGAYADEAVQAGQALPEGGVRLDPRAAPRIVLPPAVIPDSGGVVERRAASLLGRHVDDLESDEAEDVIRAACGAKDAYEVGEATSWEDAVARATLSFSGDAGRRARVDALGRDLQGAANSGDALMQLTVFSVCEVA